MDGIAVSAGSTPCPADDAGRWRLAASAFTWVDTGDPLPAGMDTVVERERVQLSADGSALITGLAPRGPHVRATGEDFQAGQLLIPAGHRLRPADLAAAAEVRRAALAADIVLVVAGSSAGRSDHTVAILAQAGGLAVRGVAVRPGHPVLLGYARQGRVQAREPTITVPVIGVPGYPLAAAVIFELFAVPLLAALQGGQPPDCVWQRVQLACDWTSSPDVEDWVPVSLSSASAGPDAGCAALATPDRRGAGAISRLMRAHAWCPIPIGQGKFARGEHIDVQLIPGAPR